MASSAVFLQGQWPKQVAGHPLRVRPFGVSSLRQAMADRSRLKAKRALSQAIVLHRSSQPWSLPVASGTLLGTIIIIIIIIIIILIIIIIIIIINARRCWSMTFFLCWYVINLVTWQRWLTDLVAEIDWMMLSHHFFHWVYQIFFTIAWKLFLLIQNVVPFVTHGAQRSRSTFRKILWVQPSASFNRGRTNKLKKIAQCVNHGFCARRHGTCICLFSS